MIGEQILSIDVEKKVQDTRNSFMKAAKSAGIKDKIITKIDIILQLDYAEHLTLKGEEEKPKPAFKALKLAEEQCKKLFLDQFGTHYAAVEIDGHIETMPLKSSRFRNWLTMAYRKAEKDFPGGEALINVINDLTARAEFDSSNEPIELFVRVAILEEDPFTIYYDLVNRPWEIIKVTPESWGVISSVDAPIFERFIQLINLNKGKTAEGVKALESTKLMLKCYIIALFFVTIPEAISMTHGEQGAAKSTGQALQAKHKHKRKIMQSLEPRIGIK